MARTIDLPFDHFAVLEPRKSCYSGYIFPLLSPPPYLFSLALLIENIEIHQSKLNAKRATGTDGGNGQLAAPQA
jgi:hypothetical protein